MLHRGPPDRTGGGGRGAKFGQSKGDGVPKASRRHDQPQQQQQDGGYEAAAAAAIADMKKVLKKARSIKRNPEDLQAHQLGRRKQTEQLSTPSPVKKTKGRTDPGGMILTPYKAPPADVSTTTPAPAPNYMKATTSSDARTGRQQKQVTKGRSLFPPAADNRLSNATPKPLPSKTPATTSKMPKTRKSSKLARKASLELAIAAAALAPADKSLLLAAPLFEDISVSKATCSSTLKDSKFPNEMVLRPGGTRLNGTSVLKVCPYNYCSLNGHHHRPPVPIRCFLAAKRRVVKAHKLRTLPSSPMRKRVVLSSAGRESELEISPQSPVLDDERNDHYFLQIFVNSNQGDDAAGSHGGRRCPEGELNDDDDGINNNDARSEAEQAPPADPQPAVDLQLIADICRSYAEMNLVDDIIDGLSNVSISETEVTTTFMDLDPRDAEDKTVHLPIKGACDELDLGEFLQQQPVEDHPSLILSEAVEVDCQQEMPEYAVDGAADQEALDSSHEIVDDDDDIFNPMAPNFLPVEHAPETEKVDGGVLSGEDQHGELPTKDEVIVITPSEEDVTILETSPPTSPKPAQPLSEMDAESGIRLVISRKFHQEDVDDLAEFNPRDPNFLPLVPDPEPEKVDLRPQMADEKKNAEEWMMDYALQRAVSKLGPARKKKVALLVEAFETIAPPRYKPAPLQDNHLSFAHTRPMQACS